MGNAKGNKVAIYVRVSTELQVDGFSLDAQVEECLAYIGMGVEYEVYKDEGISGKDVAKRIELQRLLSDVRKGEVKCVYVLKLSRLGRNLAQLLQIVEEFNEYGVNLICCKENINLNGPMGKVLLVLIGALAEIEGENIVETVKIGMVQRAKSGFRNGGRVLGYDNLIIDNGKGGKSESCLVVNEEEKVLVNRIFNLYAKGNSLRGIAHILNLEGYRTKRNGLFQADTVKYILTNKIYIGYVVYTENEKRGVKGKKKVKQVIEEKGKHESIIALDLWDEVQRIIGQKRYRKGISRGVALVSGILKCPCCGGPMNGGITKNKKKNGEVTVYRFYKCARKSTKGNLVCNASGVVNAQRIEEQVMQRVQHLLDDNKILEDIINKINKSEKNRIVPLLEEKKELENNKRANENALRRQMELYEDGKIEKNMIIKRMQELKESKEWIEGRLKEINDEIQGASGEDIKVVKVRKVISKAIKQLQTQDVSIKKRLIHELIEEIHIDSNKELDTVKIRFKREIIECLEEPQKGSFLSFWI